MCNLGDISNSFSLVFSIVVKYNSKTVQPKLFEVSTTHLYLLPPLTRTHLHQRLLRLHDRLFRAKKWREAHTTT